MLTKPKFLPRSATISALFLQLFCVTLFAQTTDVDKLQLELSKKMHDTTRLRLQGQLTKAYFTVDPTKVLKSGREFEKLAKKLKNDTVAVDAVLDIGTSYGIRSKMDSALYYFSKGYDKSKAIKYQGGIARSLTNIGFVYDRLDNKDEALNNYLEALPIYIKLGKPKGTGQCYLNIGSLYYDLGEYDMAENYFYQALETFTEAKFEKGIASALFSLGNSTRENKQYSKSLDFFNRSLGIRTRIGDVNGIALTNMGIGKLYNDQKMYSQALGKLTLALDLMRQIGDPYQEGAVLMAMVSSKMGIGELQEAEELALNVVELLKSIDSKSGMVLSLKLLSEIAKRQGDIPEAYRYQSERLAIEESIELEETARDLMMIDFKRIRSENENLQKDNTLISTKNVSYLKTIGVTSVMLFLVVVLWILAYRTSLDRKRTNKVLQSQSAEIITINNALEVLNIELTTQMKLTTFQNAELEKLNRVKTKFFSIISHDLRSPLATLKMLFSLYRSGDLNESEVKDVMERLEDATLTTSAFLDNLLEWSRSQLDGVIVKPVHFQAKNVIDENIALIAATVKLKDLLMTNKVNSTVNVFADPNMISVVIRNLLSNSVKFCQSGDKITVDATLDEDKVLLSVADTGMGISEKDKDKLFTLEHTSTLGTSGEKGYHIGLILCKDMIDQNHGKIWVETEVGKGTTFWMELPNSQKTNE